MLFVRKCAETANRLFEQERKRAKARKAESWNNGSAHPAVHHGRVAEMERIDQVLSYCGSPS